MLRHIRVCTFWVLASACIFALTIAAANAATDTWTGAVDNNWSTLVPGTNWTTSNSPAVPVNGDTLLYNSISGGTSNNDTATINSLTAITFANGAGAYTLTGTPAIALTGALTNNAGGGRAQEIDFAINGSATSSLLMGSDIGGGTGGIGGGGGDTLILGASSTFGSMNVTTNSATADTLTIKNGSTLSISNGFSMGFAATTAAGTATTLNVGDGGSGSTWNVGGATNTANFTVGLTSNNNNNPTGAGSPLVLDMSALANFNFTTTTGTFAIGYMVTRPNATVTLANTSNVITAATIGLGHSGTTSNNNAGAGVTLNLGAGSNLLYTNNLQLGFSKGAGTVKFSGSTGSVTIAGENGATDPNSLVNITVCNQSSATGTGTSVLNLAGHNATVRAATVVVGGDTGATAGSGTGNLLFDTGTFSATNMQIAVHTNGANSSVVGNLTLGTDNNSTGVLNVSAQFLLSNQTQTGTATGTFTIFGGTANINADILDSSTAGTHTTTLNLTGGTLNMMGHAIGSAATPITNVNLPAAGQTATLSNLGGTGINGGSIAGGLDLNSGGTLILTGTHTYSGNTTVDNGTLVVGTAALPGSTPAGSTVTVNSGTLSGTGTVGALTMSGGTSIRPGSSPNDSDVGTLTTGNLTFNGGTDLRVDLLHTAAGGHDLLNVNGTVTFGGGTITPGGVTDTGTYTVLSSPNNIVYTGTPTLVAPTDTRPTFALHTNAKTITIDVGGVAPKTLVWKGTVPDGGNFDWDLHNTFNWTADAADQQFFNLDRVVFNDSATNRTVTLNSSLTPADVSISNALGNDYVLTGGGSIDGATSLTKSGLGKATLAVTGNYNGTTTVTAGSLVITGSLNGTGKYAVGSGATLQIGNAGTSGKLGLGNVSNQGTVIFNRIDTPSAITNVISGSGTVQFVGTGTTELNATNAYTGTTTIQNGTVRVDSFGALGALNGGAVNITNGGTLDISGIATTNAAGGFGAKVINIASTGVGSSGVIVDNNVIAQQNAFQNITLTAASTIGGTARFDIRGGVAQLNLGTFALTKIGSGQFTVVGGTINGNGNVIVNEGTFGMETTTSSTGTGNITYNDGTTAWFFQNTGAFTRPIIINSSSLGVQMGNAAASNTAIVGSPITLNGDLTVTVLNGATTANGLNLTGVISGGHGIIKNNVSTLILSGSNTFTGGVTIADGVVQAGNAGAFNSTTPNVVTFVQSAPPTATLRTAGFNVTVGGINSDVSSPGSPVIENASTTAVTLTVSNASPNVSTFAGTIQDGTPATGTPGALSLTKAGTGTLLLSGTSNTFSGATTVQNGTLQLGNSGSLSPNSAVTIGGASTSGTLDLNGQSPTITGLNSGTTGATNILTNTSSSSPATLNIAGGTSSFGGVIKDGAQPTALTINSGSLTLSANNTFTGDTNINSTTTGGKLIVTGSLLSSGNVLVNSGATLGGTGSVGKTTLNGGSIVTPGTATAGNLTMATLTTNGGDIRYDLPTTDVGVHDKVTVSGVATFNGTATLTLVNPLLPAGGTYTLMSYGSFNDGGNPGSDPVLNVPANSRINYHYAITPTAITISPTGTPLSLTWTGAAPGDGSTWDTSTGDSSKNWSNSGGPSSNDTFFNLDAVTFGNGPTNRNVSLNTSVSPQSLTVNNSSGNDYSISGGGSIDGPTLAVTKSGSGKLTLATNNTYAGGTIINDTGTLEVGNGGGSGTLGSGGVTGPASGTGASLRINRNGSLSINGTITGILSLTVTGGAQLTLSAANTYTGATTLGNGSLIMGLAGSLPTGTALTLGDASNNSGTLELGGFNATVSGLSSVGTGSGNAITNGGAAGTLTITGGTNVFNGSIQGSTALTLQTGVSLKITGGYSATGAITDNGTLIFGVPSGNDFTLAQAITGTGSFQQTGGNVISLTNGANNNFKGGVTVSSGTLRASGSGGFTALGTGPVTVNSGATLVGTNGDAFGFTGGAGTSPLTVNIVGGTVTNATGNYRVTLPNLTFTGGNLTSIAGNNGDANGQFSLQGTVLGGVFSLITNPTSTTAVIDAPIVALESSSTFNVAAGTVVSGPTPGVDLLISSVLRNYTGAGGTVVPINKTGPGVMKLTGVNTYTGTTTVTQGSLLLGAANSIATTSQIVLNGGTLGTGGFEQDFTTSASPATLALTASSILDLGAATSATNVKFAGSSGNTWNGTLTINGWTYGTDHLSIGSNASGMLGSQLSQIKFADFVQGASITTSGEVTPLAGDINQSGTVTGADLQALEAALSDVNAYQQQYFASAAEAAADVNFILDVNRDGTVNNADLQAEINLLIHPGGGPAPSNGAATVPEPAAWLLMSMGTIAILSARNRRRRM